MPVVHGTQVDRGKVKVESVTPCTSSVTEEHNLVCLYGGRAPGGTCIAQ